MSGLFALVFAGVVIWFWIDSLRARERALSVCAAACRQTHTQLLDQTVSLTGLALGRAGTGRLMIRRQYRFEFSTDGVNRWQGRLALLGPTVETMYMENPEGATILDPGTE